MAGGQNNTAGGTYQSAVGGGYGNKATNSYATIPGGINNVASGNASFAAGNSAQATNNGAFVWSDNTATATASTNANSVTFRASGGYRFFTGTGTGGAYLAAGQTAWTTLSDRAAKKNFKPVDSQSILQKLSAVPVEQWNYRWEGDDATPNIGPMAQDFKHAFYPGRDDKGISTLEFDGIELAAIQGLNQKLDEKDAEIKRLNAKVDELSALVQKLVKQK